MKKSESQYDNVEIVEVSYGKRFKNRYLQIREKIDDSNRRKTSRYLVLKTLWLTCLLISICFCTFLISETIIQYYQYDVTTKIRDNYLDNMTFPTITLCNTNPMGTSKATHLIREYYLERYNVNITSGNEFLELFYNKTIPNDNNYIFYKTFDPSFNQTLREHLGFNIVFLCMMKNIDCDYVRDFQSYYDPKFGNCIRFNSGINKDGFLWDVHGIDDELVLVIFLGPPIDSHNLFDSLTSGLAVSVNDQNSPMLKMNWIAITPGTLGRISLTKTQVTQMPRPYSNCLPLESIDTVLSREMNKLNMTYSRINCFTLCRQKQIIDQIGCYDLRFPRILDAESCTSQSQFQRIRNNITIDTSLCPEMCPQECQTSYYDTSISYVDLFTYLSYLDILGTNRETLYRVFKTRNLTYDMFTQSFAGVQIHFREVKVTEMEESAAMSFVDLVSNIGGTIGLFIQFSLMSCVGFLELMVEVMFVLWKTKNNS